MDDGIGEVIDLESKVDLPMERGGLVDGGGFVSHAFGFGGEAFDDFVDDTGVDDRVHGADFEDGEEVFRGEGLFIEVAIERDEEVFLEGVEVGEDKVEGVANDRSVDDGQDSGDGVGARLDFEQGVGVFGILQEVVAGVKDGGDFGNDRVDLVNGLVVAHSEAVGED